MTTIQKNSKKANPKRIVIALVAATFIMSGSIVQQSYAWPNFDFLPIPQPIGPFFGLCKILGFCDKPDPSTSSGPYVIPTPTAPLIPIPKVPTPPQIFHKTITWNNINAGDCTLYDGTMVLYSDGRAEWHANAWSNGNDDSWGATVELKDRNGNTLDTMDTVWSPTLPTEHIVSTVSHGPFWEGGTWINKNLSFPVYNYGYVERATLHSHC